MPKEGKGQKKRLNRLEGRSLCRRRLAENAEWGVSNCWRIYEIMDTRVCRRIFRLVMGDLDNLQIIERFEADRIPFARPALTIQTDDSVEHGSSRLSHSRFRNGHAVTVREKQSTHLGLLQGAQPGLLGITDKTLVLWNRVLAAESPAWPCALPASWA